MKETEKMYYKKFKLQSRTDSEALFINLPVPVTKDMGWTKGDLLEITQITGNAIKIERVVKDE